MDSINSVECHNPQWPTLVLIDSVDLIFSRPYFFPPSEMLFKSNFVPCIHVGADIWSVAP